MRKKILLAVAILGSCLAMQAQNTDSTKVYNISTVIITANRLPVYLKQNPGAISFVSRKELSLMPKAIGAEEALRLVPGVRIDNQHDGERIHLSIRGQGILTERGLRGIGVMIDGIPVNDPSGFAPDLYDVDWSTIQSIEVLRGPVGALYGGSAAAGMLNINTKNGGSKPVGGEAAQSVGSNGFFKSFIQLDGSKEVMDYRLSYSRTDGAGYRDHQAFWANKLYGKINFHPTKKLNISQIISHTDYFQQNPEGLNTAQFDNLRQANPDACPFNEYQKTNRSTFGVVASYKVNASQDFQITSYLRNWDYKETSNKCAEYRNYVVPGASAQYNLHFGNDKIKHSLSAGTDMKWQKISMYKLQSGSDPGRVESTDETNIELDSLLANQLIKQSSIGVYGLYRLEAGNFNFFGNVRYDAMNNELTDKMLALNIATTSEDFTRTTFRLGASYAFSGSATVYMNWSQGFMPPSTEELASNPTGYSGFNTHLVPATSSSTELGFRGAPCTHFYYEVNAFVMKTENDFFRFKQSGRGNQEVFYGNAGNSTRKGLELFVNLMPVENLNFQLAYTFADYKYTSATIDPVYTDTAYVLTNPPADGQYLPNSPKHQLYAEIVYKLNQNLTISVGTELQSKWAIYTDSEAYSGQKEPASIYQNWQDGFNLYHARVAYQWSLWNLNWEASFFARNFTGEKYMAFTEPDPDGNYYQPGPRQEFFGTLKLKF